jgi:hypothetical protein
MRITSTPAGIAAGRSCARLPRPPRTTSHWRRKIARAVAAALDIGRKQGQAPQALPPLRAAAARSFVPAQAERDELLDIAARLSRLSISRKDPHAFFEQRSELVFELRRIAWRGE